MDVREDADLSAGLQGSGRSTSRDVLGELDLTEGKGTPREEPPIERTRSMSDVASAVEARPALEREIASAEEAKKEHTADGEAPTDDGAPKDDPIRFRDGDTTSDDVPSEDSTHSGDAAGDDATHSRDAAGNVGESAPEDGKKGGDEE